MPVYKLPRLALAFWLVFSGQDWALAVTPFHQTNHTALFNEQALIPGQTQWTAALSPVARIEAIRLRLQQRFIDAPKDEYALIYQTDFVDLHGTPRGTFRYAAQRTGQLLILAASCAGYWIGPTVFAAISNAIQIPFQMDRLSSQWRFNVHMHTLWNGTPWTLNTKLPLQQVKEGEFRLSEGALDGIARNPEVAVKRIKEAFKDYPAGAESFFYEGIRITRRKSGPANVYAVGSEENLNLLLASLKITRVNLEETAVRAHLTPLQEHEINLSVSGLKGRVARVELAAKRMAEDFEKYPLHLESFDYHGVRITRRTVNRGRMMVHSAQSEADFEKLIGILKIKKRISLKPIQAGEIVISESGLAPYIRDAPMLNKALNDALRAFPDDDESFLLGDILVTKRTMSSGKTITRTLRSEEDLKVLLMSMNYERKIISFTPTIIQPHEISLTQNGLTGLVHNPEEAAKTFATAFSEEPYQNLESFDYKGIMVTRRWSGTRIAPTVASFEDFQGLLKQFPLIAPLINPEELIVSLGLEEAFSMLGADPFRLYQYLQLFYPELTPYQTEAIVKHTRMAGVRGDSEGSGGTTGGTSDPAKAKNAAEAFLELVSMRNDLLELIRTNPAKHAYLIRAVEQSLLKHFTANEEAGFAWLHNRIETEKNPALKSIYSNIETKFLDIATTPWAVKEGQRLYFFQKYTVYEVRKLLAGGAKAVIIANEQGLGKTPTALVLMNGSEAVVISPNAVVSTWLEQEEKFISEPRLSALKGAYMDRETELASGLARALEEEVLLPTVVTNVEFMQGMTPERAALLKRAMLIIDEADYLGIAKSKQSTGSRMLEAGIKILLTATPFKKIAHIGNLLQFMFPDDPRFHNARAFSRAYPADDVESLKALYVLLQQHTIRVRKQDVFDEYDPTIPLDQQTDKLPRKREIDPSELGTFELTEVQSQSILQLFTDYQAWCEQHREVVGENQAAASPEDRKYNRFKEGYFPKLQALRQIMNDPAYIGRSDIESPKHVEMDKIIQKELDDPKHPEHKVLIFAKYVHEVEVYLKRYASYGAVGYYGNLPQDSNGYKLDKAGGTVEYYKTDDYGNYVLLHGKPVLTVAGKGTPIRALDYSRLVFQNDPKSRVMIATYESGSVGVTLTAAHAVVYDDQASTYRDEYQAGDRAHRIDNLRKKLEVRYYRLMAKYPVSFLKTLETKIRDTYFAMGTYDQVHLSNLKGQKQIFHRIMDGIGDEKELKRIVEQTLKTRMGFLFKKSAEDVEDTEITDLTQDMAIETDVPAEDDVPWHDTPHSFRQAA